MHFPEIDGYQTAMLNSTINCPTSLTANTKGSWVELTTTTRNASGFWINVDWTEYTTRNGYLVDIAFGASGSEVVVVENILYGHSTYYKRGHHMMFYVPIPVPSGTRISGRGQASATNGTTMDLWLAAQLHVGGNLPSFQCCTTIGANTTSTRGTETDPGGTAWTYGSWAEISSSTPRDIKALSVLFGFNQQATVRASEWIVQIGVGGSGSEIVLAETSAGAGCDNVPNGGNVASTHMSVLPFNIPAGSRLVARSTSNETSASIRKVDVAMYAFS